VVAGDVGSVWSPATSHTSNGSNLLGLQSRVRARLKFRPQIEQVFTKLTMTATKFREVWKLGCNGDGEGGRLFENGAMRG